MSKDIKWEDTMYLFAVDRVKNSYNVDAQTAVLRGFHNAWVGVGYRDHYPLSFAPAKWNKGLGISVHHARELHVSTRKTLDQDDEVCLTYFSTTSSEAKLSVSFNFTKAEALTVATKLLEAVSKIEKSEKG